MFVALNSVEPPIENLAFHRGTFVDELAVRMMPANQCIGLNWFFHFIKVDRGEQNDPRQAPPRTTAKFT